MKWVLINKFDEVVDTCEIASEVGVSGATTYFRKRKDMEKSEFDKLWKVMSELNYKAYQRRSSSSTNPYIVTVLPINSSQTANTILPLPSSSVILAGLTILVH